LRTFVKRKKYLYFIIPTNKICLAVVWSKIQLERPGQRLELAQKWKNGTDK